MSDMNDLYKLIYPVRQFRELLSNKVRHDGRSLDDFKPVAVNFHPFKHSLGSSALKIGNSNVICGIRGELSKPKSEKPRAGFIVPNVDMFMTPYAEDDATENVGDLVAYFMYKVLNDPKCMHIEELCVAPGDLVWTLYIDINVLEADGGLFDVSMFACAAALQTLKLPKVSYDKDRKRVTVGEEMSKLNLDILPMVTTYCFFENHALVDPTDREESIADAIFHLGVHEKTVGIFLKSGGVPISKQQIRHSVQTALHRKQEINQLMQTCENKLE